MKFRLINLEMEYTVWLKNTLVLINVEPKLSLKILTVYIVWMFSKDFPLLVWNVIILQNVLNVHSNTDSDVVHIVIYISKYGEPYTWFLEHSHVS